MASLANHCEHWKRLQRLTVAYKVPAGTHSIHSQNGLISEIHSGLLYKVSSEDPGRGGKVSDKVQRGNTTALEQSEGQEKRASASRGMQGLVG